MRSSKRTLNTADPTIVPKPTSLSLKVPIIDVKSSGAEPPAAMRVAPATSIERFMWSSFDISSRAGTKNCDKKEEEDGES